MNVVLGLGEIGLPIYLHCKEAGPTKAIDLDPGKIPENHDPDAGCDNLHVCTPGNMSSFQAVVVGYVKQLQPECLIVHSTTSPGTTDQLAKACPDIEVSHSPVHGKHTELTTRLKEFPKLYGVSPFGRDVGLTWQCLIRMGLKPVRLDNAFTSEWSKLVTTTWLGWAITFHQEIERIATMHQLDYEQLMRAFHFDSADFRSPYYPGVIRGHCVMSNIDILRECHPSPFWDIIVASNKEKETSG